MRLNKNDLQALRGSCKNYVEPKDFVKDIDEWLARAEAHDAALAAQAKGGTKEQHWALESAESALADEIGYDTLILIVRLAKRMLDQDSDAARVASVIEAAHAYIAETQAARDRLAGALR